MYNFAVKLENGLRLAKIANRFIRFSSIGFVSASHSITYRYVNGSSFSSEYAENKSKIFPV
uniref:Uncharacterized protein n=1 Tax=uncultured marine virus TaxID=186617 RepID=A0A0F7L0U2_9VIRU|nr:hypothetical protein [uncultured marine virus]